MDSIYLNVNAYNVVNNPLYFIKNYYLSFHRDDLFIDISISNGSIDPRSSNIVYNVRTPMFRLPLNSRPWKILNKFYEIKRSGKII